MWTQFPGPICIFYIMKRTLRCQPPLMCMFFVLPYSQGVHISEVSLGFGCEEIFCIGNVKYFEQLINSVRVLRPYWQIFKANEFKHYCAAACAGTCQAHMRCTAAIDELVHQICCNRFVYSWVLTRSQSVSLNASSREFSSLPHGFTVEQCIVCIGRVISQDLFRNFTFEIIDYFKCRLNGSSRPHLNQMLESFCLIVRPLGVTKIFFYNFAT